MENDIKKYNLRLILFMQVYNIYYRIEEESPSKIMDIFNKYITKAGDCIDQKFEESERMKSFILYNRIGEN